MENGFCNSDQKSMLMVGFLTCNDSDILRAKTGPYRCVGYQTNIPLTTDISNHPPSITTPPPSLLLDETGIKSVESPLASSHLPTISNSIIPNSFPDMSNPPPIQMPSMASFDNILAGLLQEAHSHITSLDHKIQKLNDKKINLLNVLS